MREMISVGRSRSRNMVGVGARLRFESLVAT